MKTRLIALTLLCAALALASGLAGGTIRYAGPVEVVKVENLSGTDYETISRHATIAAALASITDNNATHRYLIRIPPGTFDLGGSQIAMKPYVDIEGSGQGVTTITCACGSNNGPWTGGWAAAVKGADNAELRNLTVVNTGGDLYSVAIHNDTASPALTRVTASASGGTDRNYGVYNLLSSPAMTYVTASASTGSVYANAGVFNDASSPAMTHVFASASGTSYNYGVDNASSSPAMTFVTASASGGTNNTGVRNVDSSPTMNYVTATASGSAANTGVRNINSSSPVLANVVASASGGSDDRGLYTGGAGGTVTITRSSLSGTNYALYNGPGWTVKVGASRLDGSLTYSWGTWLCAESYDGGYVALNANCAASGSALPEGSVPLPGLPAPLDPPALPQPGDE